MTTHEYAEGLRQLADWYDQHPDVEPPYQHDQLNYFTVDKDHCARLLRQIGGFWRKDVDFAPGLILFRQPFGAFTMRVIVNRVQVCERRVVGYKDIPARPAERVEVVEWDCAPILGEVPEPAR